MSDSPATMLQFDWEAVEDATVTAVVARGVQAMSDGSLACAAIALVLGRRAVVVQVNADTDEVIVSLTDDLRDISIGWQPLGPLAEIVSRTLGWCWVGRNYRGYLDTFTFAVDGIDPAYCFIGMAAKLQCARVTPITG